MVMQIKLIVVDTTPKCIEREGLGRRRTGTRQRPQQCRHTTDHFTVVGLVSWPLSGRDWLRLTLF